MSDKDLSQQVSEVMGMLKEHIVETRIYREQRDKVIDAHSKVLWGNGEPGLEKKVDRLEQTEETRKWAIRAIGGTSLALLVERFMHVLK